MAKPLLDETLWEQIAPLLPAPKPRRFRYPGRNRIGDREALSGIIFVLRSGIPWEMLPREMGFGSGMTCWRRLRDWQQAGVWLKLQHLFLERLHKANEIDWSRALVDSGSIRAVGAGEKNRPQSNGSKQTRHKTSYYNRRRWNSLGRSYLRCFMP